MKKGYGHHQRLQTSRLLCNLNQNTIGVVYITILVAVSHLALLLLDCIYY